MITPAYLKPGDKIGIIAPARKVTQEEMEPGIAFLKSKGFEVVTGKNMYGNHNQFSGTDNERAADFQSMIDDKSIRAIMAARGGYGTVRIIDDLEFDPLMDDPKWICGFSDMTVVHNHIHNYLGMETIHSAMLINLIQGESEPSVSESLIKALTGEKLAYSFETPEKFQSLNKPGGSEGMITGGNLSIMYALHGTASDIDTKGKILFLEDLDEYLYHIDRMMMGMKRTGKLEHLVGLVVGGMNDMKDNTVPFGQQAEEIIRGFTDTYEFPVCFGFPAGHIKNNHALILGREVDFNVEDHTVTLTFMDSDSD